MECIDHILFASSAYCLPSFMLMAKLSQLCTHRYTFAHMENYSMIIHLWLKLAKQINKHINFGNNSFCG